MGCSSSPFWRTGPSAASSSVYPVSETTVYPLRQIDYVTVGESVRRTADEGSRSGLYFINCISEYALSLLKLRSGLTSYRSTPSNTTSFSYPKPYMDMYMNTYSNSNTPRIARSHVERAPRAPSRLLPVLSHVARLGSLTGGSRCGRSPPGRPLYQAPLGAQRRQ